MIKDPLPDFLSGTKNDLCSQVGFRIFSKEVILSCAGQMLNATCSFRNKWTE